MSLNRRDFLKTASAASLAPLAGPFVHTRPRARAHQVALIGSGWWGMNILREALAEGQSTVAGLCDVDQRALQSARDEVETLTGTAPPVFVDFDEMLVRTRPTLVIVATPDHWHALAAIAAMKAGAHVYLEKPISHTLDEAWAIYRVARNTDRVVQIGTHRRVSPHNRSGMAFLKEGHVGDIGMVRTFVHYGGGPGTPTPDSPIPEGLDWDRWCGPAPLRPYNERIHPRGFRQYLDFANGQIGDWGIHWLDQVLWWTEEKYPHTVYSTGDRFIKADGTDAPDTQVAVFQFESFTATWEHRLYAGNAAEQSNIGCYFYGTKGTFHMGWLDGWTFYPSNDKAPVVHEDSSLNAPDHQNIKELWADFLLAIDLGTRPTCDVEHGYHATCMSLLGMVSLKLGRSVRWDGDRGLIVGDEEARALQRRPYREPWAYPEV